MSTSENPRFDLSGRSAVVTGGGRGLGRAGAIALAQAGARVVVGARSLDECETTVQLIRDNGGEAFASPVDVANRDDCERFVAASVEQFGDIHIALFAAGVIDMHAAEDASDDEWNRALSVNLTGAFLSVQSIGRRMISQGSGGSIIVVSSNASLVAFPGLLAYNASKGGVDQMVKTCAAEWGKHGIRVNAIAPGYMSNVMRDAAGQGERDEPGVVHQIEHLTPLARTGSDDEFAGPVVFLASDAAGFITGVVLPVDGGYTAL